MRHASDQAKGDIKNGGERQDDSTNLFPIWARRGGSDLTQKYAGDAVPLRSELLSADQMEQHGKLVAGVHQLKPGRPRDRLLARLAENQNLLLEVHKLLTEAVKDGRRITPAGEWLLDNFYVIEEQIRTARRHLPKGYSRELPRLSRTAHRPGCRGCTTSLWRRSRTAMAGWIRKT